MLHPWCMGSALHGATVLHGTQRTTTTTTTRAVLCCAVPGCMYQAKRDVVVSCVHWLAARRADGRC